MISNLLKWLIGDPFMSEFPGFIPIPQQKLLDALLQVCYVIGSYILHPHAGYAEAALIPAIWYD